VVHHLGTLTGGVVFDFGREWRPSRLVHKGRGVSESDLTRSTRRVAVLAILYWGPSARGVPFSEHTSVFGIEVHVARDAEPRLSPGRAGRHLLSLR
jgi:hypothetical protein